MARQQQVYTWKQAKDLIREQGYKHVALCDLHGKKVCSYNAISKGDKGLREKLAEIDTRMKAMAPGIYVLNCKTKYGNTSPELPHYVGVGQYDASELSEPNQPVILNSRSPRNGQRANSENLTSVDTALEHVRTIAQLEAENDRLKDKIARQDDEIRELKADLDDLEAMGEDSNPLTPVAEGLFPIIDRYLDVREREGKREDMKMLLKQGYDLDEILGTGSRSSRRSRRSGSRRSQRGSSGRKAVPRPGERGWDKFVDHVDALDDDDFEELIEQLRENDPEIYEALQDEIGFEDTDDTQEEEEQEEQEQQEQE